jgi:CheY-like chemotaxis protein
VVEAPRMARVLVVDDNDTYAERIANFLKAHGTEETVRAHNAAEGIEILGAQGDRLDGVVTDISMERELAGLSVLAYARDHGFRGHVATASTAFDRRLGFFINRFILGGWYKSEFLIPKKPIIERDEHLWVRVRRG